MKKSPTVFLILVLIFTIISLKGRAQDYAVSGTVTDAANNDPIPGVTILIKGTMQGTVTDIDGNFNLMAGSDAILVFSFVGMKSQEIKVSGKTNISIVLEPDIIGLEEVVAIGYGTSKVKDLTAPIATVDSEELTKVAALSAVSAIQGVVPGVQVINSGAPQGGPSVRIRGIASMQGASPLYVIDGIYFDDIDWLNPNDIGEISILKDASAAAIYGVRAAGGVILVTTKSGKRNQNLVINYDGYVGLEATTRVLQMCNGKEYATMMVESGQSAQLQPMIDAFGTAPDKITWRGVDYSYPARDWDYYDELMKNGQMMNHNLSMRGGGDKADYSISVGYYSAEGRLINDHIFERLNLTTKINFDPYKWLRLGTNINITSSKNKNGASTWNAMYNAVPLTPIWEDNGDYGQRSIYGFVTGSATANPIVTLDQADGYGDYSGDTGFTYSAYTDIDFFSNDKLIWHSQVMLAQSNGSSRNYAPAYQSGIDWSRLESTLNKGMSKYSQLQTDHTLTYQDSWDNHALSLMAGLSTRRVDSRSLSGLAEGVPWGENGREEFLYLFNGNSGSQVASDGGYSNRGNSYIGRLMYNYAHKYLLNATFRADGTDKYSETWGYFPSVGVGWVLSEESFMKDQDLFSYAKVRASWGQLGNNNVPRESGSQSIDFGLSNATQPFKYSYIFDGIIVSGYQPSLAYNTLQWEVTTEFNFGLDLGLLDDKLSVEADWYRKITSDAAILSNGLMGSGVTPSLIRNKGEILNTGFEFTADWQDKIGDLGYKISANITTLHNEVLKLSDEYILGGTAERRIRTEVGQPLYSFYGKKVIGIYQNQAEIDQHLYGMVAATRPEPGYFKYEDLNQDGIIDASDEQFLGANIPKLVYGGNLALDYKGFDFGLRVYGIYGNKIQNGAFSLRSVRSHHTDQNMDKALYENRWTKEGDNTSPASDGLYYPSAKAMISGNAWNFSFGQNSFLIENGSFFKIQNVTLGYTFKDIIPGSKNGSSVRIRLSADNPYTFFKYNGFDPNVGGDGRDDNTYPLASNFIVGINITY